MKKLIIAITSVAVAAGGTFGAYKLNEKRKTNKAVAEVTPVSLMTDYYYGDTLELGGMISSGNIQNVMPDDQKLVEKVLVKEGDRVKKGDPLLKYDITALELDLKQKENAVAVADSDIKTANKELTKLKNLKSSEMMPEPPEPTFPPTEAPTEPPQPENPVVETKDTIKNTADSVSGDGSSKNPLVFNCTPETVVTGELFSTLKESGGYAVFNVYDENSEMLYQWRISGADINDTQISDKVIGENVSADADGNITVSWSENTFGSYTVPKTSDIPEDYSYDESYEEEPFDYESYYEDFYNSVHRNYDEDYMYSKAELAKMISEKENEITKLEIDKKSAELEYRIAKEQKESGSITARIDGVVTQINDAESLEAGQPYLVVQGEGGLTVKGYIGELNLDKVSPGSIVNITFWETGEMAEAEVTEVNNVPVSYESQNWGENPNSSTYEFTAAVTDDITVPSDAGISITLPYQEESSSIYIPKVYVREEDGRSYVFKADENGRLKKQYVKTGKTIYGYETEILGGLSESDKICFPYGKNIKEGIKTKDSDEVLW